MRVLLIAGGWSSERAVSLSGAKVLHESLLRLGHQVTFYDPASPSAEVLKAAFSKEAEAVAEARSADFQGPLQGAFPGALTGLLELAQQHDFAFINLHGSPGEDGLIQAMLESAGCPYQGSGAQASFLALHKVASKHIFRKAGLLTPDWEFLTARPETGWRSSLTYPLFVKANNGGSSLHLHRVERPEKLPAVLDEIFDAGAEALLEPLIVGKEVTCAVLGEEALPPILIEPVLGDFFDYESKYRVGGAREICPAPLAPEILLKIQKDALLAHKALGLKGYSRADFILTPVGQAFLLEVNTLPGMTSTSLLPQAAAAAGISFDQLIARLIELGLG